MALKIKWTQHHCIIFLSVFKTFERKGRWWREREVKFWKRLEKNRKRTRWKLFAWPEKKKAWGASSAQAHGSVGLHRTSACGVAVADVDWQRVLESQATILGMARSHTSCSKKHRSKTWKKKLDQPKRNHPQRYQGNSQRTNRGFNFTVLLEKELEKKKRENAYRGENSWRKLSTWYMEWP